jgi:hypothetical protein
MPEDESPAASLAAAILRQLAPVDEARPFLEGWPALAATRAQTPRQLPVCRSLHLVGSLAAPATQGLVDLVARSTDVLEWRQTYSASDFGSAFLDGYGWTELIGRRGPIPSERIACGVLLLGPEIEYPDHAHEAEELYLPLAGAAHWRKGAGDFAMLSPGTPVVHRSWEPHAMRTGPDPMLALYVWKGGDLAAKSKIVRED